MSVDKGNKKLIIDRYKQMKEGKCIWEKNYVNIVILE